MAKNHYVSQLIIKRFSPRVKTFDIMSRRKRLLSLYDDIIGQDVSSELYIDFVKAKLE